MLSGSGTSEARGSVDESISVANPVPLTRGFLPAVWKRRGPYR